MNATEKSTIYKFIKTASDAFYGYSSPDFPKQMPSFSDDLIKESVEQTENKSVKSSAVTIEDIAKKIEQCKRCKLCQKRNRVVPGEGVLHPEVLVIGEGPGEEEDKYGRPFVGPAGILLDKMLSAINLDRKKNCFIANIVKCRPPENRNPSAEEAEACSSFLEAQILCLKPKMILALGSVALKNLLQTENGITKMHGTFFDYNGIPFMATYHPSALLRDANLKLPAWNDLKIFRAKLQEIAPNYDSTNL